MSALLKNLSIYYKNENEFGKFSYKLNQDESLNYGEFCSKMLAWEKEIRSSFLFCLHSGEYMQTRNSILILDKINEYFPITLESGKKIESIIKKLEKNETRGDLKQLARSYYGKLQLRKKEWTHGPVDDEKSTISDDNIVDLEVSNISVENAESIKNPEDDILFTAADISLTAGRSILEESEHDTLESIPERTNAVIVPEGDAVKSASFLEKDKEEGEQIEDESMEQNELNSGSMSPEITRQVIISSMEGGEALMSSREDQETVLSSAHEEGEAEPDSSAITVDADETANVEPEIVNEASSASEIQGSEGKNLDKMEVLRKVLRERVEASRRVQDKTEKSFRDETNLVESPSKIARGQEELSDNQRIQQNGDFRIFRSIRDRDNFSQRDYEREGSPKESHKYIKDFRDRDLSRNTTIKSYPDKDHDRGTVYSERAIDRNGKFSDYQPRDYDRNFRYKKDYQGRDREIERERRDYRSRSSDRQKDKWIKKQAAISQRNFKDVVTGAMLENIKKDKIQYSKPDESRKLDSKDPQMRRDVYFPPATKEENRIREEPRARKDFNFYDRKNRDPERTTGRNSPQIDREIDTRIPKKSRSVERSWNNDKRREFDFRQNTYRKDVYTPQDPYESKSRNIDEYREKRSRVPSYEKDKNDFVIFIKI